MSAAAVMETLAGKQRRRQAGDTDLALFKSELLVGKGCPLSVNLFWKCPRETHLEAFLLVNSTSCQLDHQDEQPHILLVIKLLYQSEYLSIFHSRLSGPSGQWP